MVKKIDLYSYLKFSFLTLNMAYQTNIYEKYLTEYSNIKTKYIFKIRPNGYLCQINAKIPSALNNTEINSYLDCYAIDKTKTLAKNAASAKMYNMLQLIIPMVPFSMLNQSFVFYSKYAFKYSQKAEFKNSTTIYLNEIIYGNIFLEVDFEQKLYRINFTAKNYEIHHCPMILVDNPARYTDWSIGPVCPAQNNYIIGRLDNLYVEYLKKR